MNRHFFGALVLGLLALAAPLGGFLKVGELRLLGLASLASPLLIVYSEVGGTQAMTYQPTLELSLQNGENAHFSFDRSLYTKIASHENHFNRHILIIPYMAANFLMLSPGKQQEDRLRILSFGLCNNGRLAHYLDLQSEVVSFRVHIAGIPAGRDLVQELEGKCAS